MIDAVEMALLLRSDGSHESVRWMEPWQAFGVIRAALHEAFVEQVRLAPDVLLYADEDGKRKRLPVNHQATALVHSVFPGRLWPDDFFVGPVVIAGDDGSEDIVGLDPKWLTRFGMTP